MTGGLLVLLQPPAERVDAAGEAADQPGALVAASHAGPYVAGVEAADHAQQALGGPGDEPVHDQRAAHEAGQAQQAEAGQLEGEQPVGAAEHRRDAAARSRSWRRWPERPPAASGSKSTRLATPSSQGVSTRPDDRSGQQGLERLVEQLAGPSLGLGVMAQDHAVAVDQHHGRARGQRALDHGPLELAQVERGDEHARARCRPRRSPGVSGPPSAGGGLVDAGPAEGRVAGLGGAAQVGRVGTCREPGAPLAPSRSPRRPVRARARSR